MGFFLSKLLPIFVYPLGLACLLLVVAIFCFWKRPRLTQIALTLSLTVLLIAGNPFFSGQLLGSLEMQNLPQPPLPQAAAIVILGGATRSADPPRPWVEVLEAGDRILYGAKLYREGKAPVVILSGGRVDWWEGDSIGASESADMAELITTMGVPKTAILQDPTSLNTYENAVNVQKILQDKNIRGAILLVTSAIHMPRSLAIFRHLGLETIAAPTDFYTATPVASKGLNLTSAIFGLLPTAEALQHTTLALKEYIGLVVYRVQGRL